jgi:hypothetical protein
MSETNWDKELKKIDRQLEGLSDEALLPAKAAPSPAGKAAVIEKQQSTRTLGAFLRLSLSVALGAGVLFWPYAARCGPGLAAYLGAVAAVGVGGIWSAVWTWKHRTAKAHTLSILLVVWGLVLAAIEVLPRVGYAKPTLDHPAIWSCQ